MRIIFLALILLSAKAYSEQDSHDSFTVSSFSFQEPWEHYRVSIFGDGTTVLIIENESATIRTFKLPNTLETFIEVLELLDRYQFSTFSDSYGLEENGVDPQCQIQRTHHGISILSLQYSGEHKTVRINHGCKGFIREEELNILTKRAKDILGLMDYVGT